MLHTIIHTCIVAYLCDTGIHVHDMMMRDMYINMNSEHAFVVFNYTFINE